MASTFSDLLRLEKQASGEHDTTWGDVLNTQMEMVEDAVAGRAAIVHSDAASYSLTTANGADDEARKMILNIAGTLTANRNAVVPTSSKVYVTKNATVGGFAVTLKTAAGTGIAIPNGKTTLLASDGTNVVNAIDYLNTLTCGTFGVRSSGTGAFDLQLASTENLTANRALTVTLNDAARTVNLGGNLTTAAAFVTSGANSLTLTTTGPTNVTVPTAGTLSAIAGTETLTNKRVTPRVTAAADGVAVTPNADNEDITTQVNTQALGTLTVNAPGGTPTNGQRLMLRVKSTNAHTITWNGTYRGSLDFGLPGGLSGASKTDYFGLQWHAGDTKWDLIAYVAGF